MSHLTMSECLHEDIRNLLLTKCVTTSEETPFKVDNNKLYVCYDSMVINFSEKDKTVVEFYFKQKLISGMEIIGEIISIGSLTIYGLDGKMEIKL